MTSSAITGNTSGLASATSPGLVGISTQTFAGEKTFNDATTFKSSSGTVASGLYSSAGSWTFGPQGYTGTHNVNAATVNFSRSATPGVSQYRIFLNSGNSQTSPVVLGTYGDNSSLLLQAGETAGIVSSINIVGNWNGSSATGGKVSINTAATERFSIDNAGNKSFVNGSIFIGASAIGAGAGTYPVKWNSSSGVLTYDTSSRLLKENIVDCPYGLTEVLNLLPRKYFRKDDQKEEVGFIADEVESIIPEAVCYVEKSLFTKDDKDVEQIPGGVHYEKLTSVLVKAIQEQQAQIQELKQQIALLK